MTKLLTETKTKPRRIFFIKDKNTLVKITQPKEKNSIVKEIYNLFSVLDLLNLTNHQKNILVIFDVDDVLITPSSEDDLRHPFRNQLLQSILNRIKPQEIELLKSSILLNTKQVLVELNIIDIFEHLKSYRIPTIAYI